MGTLTRERDGERLRREPMGVMPAQEEPSRVREGLVFDGKKVMP